MPKSLDVAVVGYGLGGSVFHAPLVEATEGLHVAAIVTRNPERAAQARSDFPAAHVVNSADEVVREPGAIDLVVVATPNRVHASVARLAIEHGIPVVVDKPLAPSVAETEALVDFAQSAGVPLSVFQNRRWDADFLTLVSLRDSGALGPILRLESRFERYRPQPRPGAWREDPGPREAGGLLWDLGSHLIDQALVLFGDPDTVYAESLRRRPGVQVDDDTFVALSFASGAIAHLWMNVIAHQPGPRFRVLGRDATWEKYGLDPQEADLKAGRRPGQEGWGDEPPSLWGKLVTHRSGEIESIATPSIPGAYERFYVLMRDALLTNTRVPVAPGDAVKTARVIEAAAKSAATRGPVQLR